MISIKRKKKSLIDQRRETAANLQEQVIELLRWTEMEYNTFQFESGLAFVESYISRDSPYGQVLLQSRVFWAWWKNQWALRNEIFVRDVDRISKRWCIEDWYKTMNSGKALACHTHPNRRVIDDSYAEMITKFVNDERSKG